MAMTQKEIEENIHKVSILYCEITDLQNIKFEMRETPDGNFIMMTGNKMFRNSECGVKVPATLSKEDLSVLTGDVNDKVKAAVKAFVKARKDAIKDILSTLTKEMSNGVQ